VTYRPEEKAWKQEVHAAGAEPATDPAEAARRLFSDDGMSTGIFYRGRPSPRAVPARLPVSCDLTAIEASFAL
jgi:2-oxoglutarate ferredoxin oxidoreductase subunit beta